MGEIVMTGKAAMGQDEALAVDKQVNRIIVAGDKMAIELGQLLRDIRDRHGWKALGYPSFDDYIRARFNRRLRWAQDRIQTADALRSRPALRAAAEELGPTKVRTIAQAKLSPAGEAAVLNAAPSISTRDLAELVHQEKKRERKAREAGGEAEPADTTGVEVPSSIHFSVYPGQKGTIERALELASHASDSQARGHLLEMIAAEFIATYATPADMPRFAARMRALADDADNRADAPAGT